MAADVLATKLAHADLYREATPSDDDMLDIYVHHAHEYHDVLVEMGGRPTRAVLEEPAGKAIYGEDEVRIVDNHGQLQCTIALDENLTLHHWTEECARFEEELDRWKEFRDYQQTMEDKPLLKTAFDAQHTDQRLVTVLVRLNDWREFQHYQQINVGRALMRTWQITRKSASIMRKEALSDEAASSPEIPYGLAKCLHELIPRQEDLQTSQKQLTWIESQISEILSEASASLEAAPSLQRQLEVTLEQQSDAFYQELTKLEARPDQPVQSPCQSAGFAQKIRYWDSEISRLLQVHWEWKIFLKWRQKQPYASGTANIEVQRTSGLPSDLQIRVDYVAYRQYQLERIRSCIASWQQLLKLKESYKKVTPRDQGLWLLEDSISTVRAYVKKFQQDVQSAELQVQLAEQQLAELSSQRFSSVTYSVTQRSNMHSQLLPSPPDSNSTEGTFENFVHVNLSSSSTKVHRTRSLTKSPIGGNPSSAQRSNVAKKGRTTRAKAKMNNARQPVTVADAIVPNLAMVDNDNRSTDAPDFTFPDAKIRHGEGVKPIETPMSEVEDTLMTNVEDPVETCSRIASEAHSKARGTRMSIKPHLPIYQVSTSRKTRSANKLDQNISGRVLKHTGKKSTRKAISFTEKQAMALLSAPSVNGSPTDSPPLRRSERLKEKAAPLSPKSPPQFNAAEPLKASRLKKPGEQPSPVKSSQPPRQKKPKVQPSALKSLGKSRQRKPKIPTNAVEPSKSSRRKRVKT